MMLRLLTFLVAVSVAAIPVSADELPTRPNPALTPGLVASTDPADVCGRVDGLTYSQRHRDTTKKMKADTYAAYHIDKAGRDFEVDHRVPLCAGGADDAKNLWPQEGWQHPSFHDKDRLETFVCRAICITHKMTLAEGQAVFLGDWVACFEKVYGQPPQ